MASIANKIRAYFSLTKPTILLLVVLTGAAGLVVEGGLSDRPAHFALVLILLGMAGGSANAFNQYFERDVDARMRRTRKRRPLPRGTISPTGALIFAVLLGVASTAGFWHFFNPLSAMLSLGTILFYALFYTLYLKPRTPENIVIGGIAGSMGPVIAWAASSGTLALPALLMFLVIFFWTPPHFWALAVYMRDDYVDVGYPMMPVVAGDEATWRRGLFYAGLMIAASLALLAYGAGWFYAAAAVVLGAGFVRTLIRAKRDGGPLAARTAFSSSILYLLVLFTAIILDWSLFG